MDAKENGTFDSSDSTFQGPIGRYTVYGDPEGSYAVLNEMIEEDRFVHSAYDAPLTDEQADVSATLQKMTIETIVKIITGSEDVEYYDTFLDTWMANGGETYLNDVQEWIAENPQ